MQPPSRSVAVAQRGRARQPPPLDATALERALRSRRGRARCASTPAAARSTPPTPRTTARCRSAWSCRATSRTWSRRGGLRARYGAPVAGARRRHQPRGPVLQRRRRDRLLEVPEPHPRARPERAARAVAARAGARSTCATRAEQHHLTFGPDPSTHNHCTLGGMIGNNSCGVHSVMGGKTRRQRRGARRAPLRRHAPHASGRRARPSCDAIMRGAADGAARSTAGCARCATATPTRSARRFPHIPRRVSGYNLPQLLPENGFNVARALVGTEGTCVTVLDATVRLVPSPPARSLLVLGYPDVYAAGRPRPRGDGARADRLRGHRRAARRRHEGEGHRTPSDVAAPARRGRAGCWSSSAASTQKEADATAQS